MTSLTSEHTHTHSLTHDTLRSYYPKVKMDQVVLPDESKKLILETVEGKVPACLT
jgi:hypothetical protein